MRVMNTPRSMDLEITTHCNLRCAYCSHFSSAGDVTKELSTDEWLQFFGELQRCRVMDVCLQGGEPLLRPDFQELVKGIVQNRMRFSILTNGTLLTEDLASFLASTGRCNSIQVSIDGSSPEPHDAFRGKGTFELALRGLRTALDARLPATVRVTIHRRNVGDLQRLARLLLEDLNIPEFSTNAASHFGLCRKNADLVQLTVRERSQAMATLLELSRKYNGRISAMAGPLAEAYRWLALEQALAQGVDRFPNGGFLTGCGGSFSKLGVRADGTIVPCTQLSAMELGRINRDDLQEVWLRHPELNRFRGRSSIPLSDFPLCRGCKFINYCTGNCPALAESLLCDPYHPSPDVCYKRFLEAGGEPPVTDALWDESDPDAAARQVEL